MRILTTLLIALILSTDGQAQLPTPETTSVKAITDFVDGKINEGWFKTALHGRVAYTKMFQATTEGIRNAYEQYNVATIQFHLGKCEDYSVLHPSTTRPDGTIDYRMMAATVHKNTTMIDRVCKSENPKIDFLSLKSSDGEDADVQLTIVTFEEYKKK